MRILVLAGFSESLINFRGHLLRSMIRKGYEVHVAAPNLLCDSRTLVALREMGATAHDLSMERTGVNPVKDFFYFIAICKLLLQLRPLVVLSYTIKPVIWGGLAAWFTGVPKRYALITGLGYAFASQATGKRYLIRLVASFLYKLSLRRATLVFFQNAEDAVLFRDTGLLSRNVPMALVNGSGVDLEKFQSVDFPALPVIFLMIARLISDKGVREYVQAAKFVRAIYPNVEFHLVGDCDANPDSISIEEVNAWVAAGDILWHGPLSDVRPAIAKCHVYVLPSYREGLPRTVLEAMAMGRPIITTDAPGCRDTVEHGRNGFIVPVKSAEQLAEAMIGFIERVDLIALMGGESRLIAESKFNVHEVNSVMLDSMRL